MLQPGMFQLSSAERVFSLAREAEEVLRDFTSTVQSGRLLSYSQFICVQPTTHQNHLGNSQAQLQVKLLSLLSGMET